MHRTKLYTLSTELLELYERIPEEESGIDNDEVHATFQRFRDGLKALQDEAVVCGKRRPDITERFVDAMLRVVERSAEQALDWDDENSWRVLHDALIVLPFLMQHQQVAEWASE